MSYLHKNDVVRKTRRCEGVCHWMHCPWEGLIEMGHRAVIITPYNTSQDESRMHRLCFDDASRVNDVFEEYEEYKNE